MVVSLHHQEEVEELVHQEEVMVQWFVMVRLFLSSLSFSVTEANDGKRWGNIACKGGLEETQDNTVVSFGKYLFQWVFLLSFSIWRSKECTILTANHFRIVVLIGETVLLAVVCCNHSLTVFCVFFSCGTCDFLFQFVSIFALSLSETRNLD